MSSDRPDQSRRCFDVAVLVPMFPNIVQTYVLNHIISLIEAGCNTTIFAVRDPGQDKVHPDVDNYALRRNTHYIYSSSPHVLRAIREIPVFSLRYWRSVTRIIFSDIWRRYGLTYGIQSILQARALCKAEFELSHSHSLFESYRYLFLKEVFGIPMVTTFHGLVPNDVKMLEQSKIESVLASCSAFLVNTRFASKQLIDMGCDTDKIHIIPQATNTQDFPFTTRVIKTDEPIIVLSVGRLSVEKGFHVAIRAIARLVDTFPNIEYRIIGSGIEHERLSEQISEAGLQDNVTLCGGVSTEELKAHYAEAHIFVLPSIDFRDGTHTETQGVVLQEAQSSGIPIIASRTGGIPEVIKDGATGLLFDEENDQQLAALLSRIIKDETYYERLCQQARKDVEDNYSISVIRDRLFSIYESALAADD